MSIQQRIIDARQKFKTIGTPCSGHIQDFLLNINYDKVFDELIFNIENSRVAYARLFATWEFKDYNDFSAFEIEHAARCIGLKQIIKNQSPNYDLDFDLVFTTNEIYIYIN